MGTESLIAAVIQVRGLVGFVSRPALAKGVSGSSEVSARWAVAPRMISPRIRVRVLREMRLPPPADWSRSSRKLFQAFPGEGWPQTTVVFA
ncbi:MAG TPA: hypothetical protein DCE44_18790 [Verrucomicrobiales bacterium]|nr:hypothetical protein [Verrucomicrobiales bacterium]